MIGSTMAAEVHTAHIIHLRSIGDLWLSCKRLSGMLRMAIGCSRRRFDLTVTVQLLPAAGRKPSALRTMQVHEQGMAVIAQCAE